MENGFQEPTGSVGLLWRGTLARMGLATLLGRTLEKLSGQAFRIQNGLGTSSKPFEKVDFGPEDQAGSPLIGALVSHYMPRNWEA